MDYDDRQISGILAALGEAALDAVIVSDAYGTIIYWNPRAEDCFGWSAAEARGELIHELLIRECDRDAHLRGMQAFREATTRPKGSRLRTRALMKSGDEITVELSLMALDVGDQRFPVCFARDLTEIEAARHELEVAQLNFIHLSRMNAMGTMAAALAHELSQPLEAARNYLTAATMKLSKQGLPAAVEHALSAADGSLERATQTLRSIRDMVSKRPPRRQEHLLVDLVEEVSSFLQSRLSTRLTVDVAQDANLVSVDRIQIEQVFFNLLRNAMDATAELENPHVHVEARLLGSMVEIRVTDNGAGIEPGHRKKLFGAFQSTKSDGFGMGLAISRVIVERAGGKLWLDETSEKTSFCFTVPAGGVNRTVSNN